MLQPLALGRCLRSSHNGFIGLLETQGLSSLVTGPASSNTWQGRVLQRPIILSRWQSTASKSPTTPPKLSPNIYPERINIYDSGSLPQLLFGGLRLVFLTGALFGNVVLAPASFFDPSSPWWTTPAVMLVSTLPFLASVLAFGPYVWHVYVFLPSNARRSREALMRFAANTPPATRLQIVCIRASPFPKRNEIAFDELRRLPTSRLRLANLEWIPWRSGTKQEKGVLAWLIRQYLGRYFINRSQVRERAAVRGVWDKMWEQLLFVGGEGQSAGKAKLSVKMEKLLPASSLSKATPTRRPAPISKR